MTLAVPARKPTAWYLFLSNRFQRVQRIPAKIRQLILAKGIRWLYRKTGIEFLSGGQTVAFLDSYRLAIHPANTLLLSEIVDLAEPGKIYFASIHAETQPVSIWRYDAPTMATKLLPYGGILTQQKLFCTDANTDDFFRNVVHRTKRTNRHTQTLIAPWSHYLDGVVWGGYYDFVILVAGKLCRIKDALPESVFSDALVAYPLFNTSYEAEYLTLLGLDADRVLDSRTTDVTFNECILADVGHWFYPNRADIDALRKHVLTHMPPAHDQRNRIYISRSCRRRILNEGEVIDLLKRYDFRIIEDIPRSVAEQVSIYQNAEFIIGPHGASFTNILWCQPGTYLFELFSPTYVPDFFRNLAQQLGLHYHAYYHGPAGTDNWAKGLEDDLYVSVPELKRCLEKLLT